jgi:hypothetical protein|tara:strand:- start:7 stop:2700 length:2694 start_codon:yes stop_codon:yes gene_type:complete
MAEATVSAFEAMPDEARNKKFNNFLAKVTSQEVGGRSFSDMYNALQEAEVGAYKERKGYPYIFTAGSKKSSAFGPMQITYSTALDYFYDGANETEQRENMKAGNFKEGYTQLPPEVKKYIKSFIQQGINKRNNKGGVFGSLGVGNISKEDHEKYYPFLAGVHFTEKKKLAADDSKESFVNAHFGDIREDDPQKENKQKQLANLQAKVSTALGVTAMPATGEEPGFSEPRPVPEPEPKPAPAAPETKVQTDDAFTIDYEGELPDIGDDVPMPDLPAEDVAPETTDAIPVIDIEPEQPSLFGRIGKSISDLFSSDESDAEGEQMRQDMLDDLESSYGIPQMNKGGMPVEKQMDMFDDGGLLDEGGMIDEESGNDVPSGSLREEVRDDIPAQLSEGEFVFPADVVRYIGLEKLMQMRQEAKAGLARMEAMGQMGNSEEAVLPDDIPFDLDDIDMEDDTMEFQTGGLVPNQFGVYQQPSQFANYTPTTYQAPTIPAGQPIQQQPLQTGFTPLTTPAVPTADGTVPTFEQLIPTTTGRYDELREYINEETGQTMTIPFVDGKPIYPIPEGFREVGTDVVEPTETKSTLTDAQLRNMRELATDEQDRDDTSGFASSDVTGIGYDKSKLDPLLKEAISDFGFGFGALADTFGKASIAGAASSMLGKDPRASASTLTSSSFGGVLDAFRGGDVNFTDRPGSKTGTYDDNTSLHEMSLSKQRNIANVARTVVTSLRDIFVDDEGRAKPESQVRADLIKEAKANGISTTIAGTNVTHRLETIARELSKKKTQDILAQKEAERQAEQARVDAIIQKQEDDRKSGALQQAAQQAKQDDDYSDFATQYGISTQTAPGETKSAAESIADAVAGGADLEAAAFEYGFNTGGLAAKKKPKTKKMKRGGLASKK